MKNKLFLVSLFVAFFSFQINYLLAQSSFAWVKSMGGNVAGISVIADDLGNVYSTGYFKGTADFDPGAEVYNLTATGIFDIYIIKLDASGNFLWAKNMGGFGTSYGYCIDLDSDGNVFTYGIFTNTVDFDPGVGTYELTALESNCIYC